jgi:hypothetical protein
MPLHIAKVIKLQDRQTWGMRSLLNKILPNLGKIIHLFLFTVWLIEG